MNCAYLRYKAISAERGRRIQDEKNKALDNNRYTTKPSLYLIKTLHLMGKLTNSCSSMHVMTHHGPTSRHAFTRKVEE